MYFQSIVVEIIYLKDYVEIEMKSTIRSLQRGTIRIDANSGGSLSDLWRMSATGLQIFSHRSTGY